MRFEKIKQLMDECHGKTSAAFGLAFYDLETGAHYELEGDRRLPTASIFKLWLLALLYRMAERGEVSLAEEWTYEEKDFVPGSGVLIHLEPGSTKLTLGSFAKLMMMYSDNAATDKILKRVGLERLQAFTKEFGFQDTFIGMGCDCVFAAYEQKNLAEDGPAGGNSYRNMPFYGDACPQYTSANDLVRYFRLLEGGKLLGPEMTKKAIALLEECQTNSRIPAKLPANTPVAHKTGTLNQVVNDAGIVTTPAGRYVLAFLYDGNLAGYEDYLANARNRKAEPMLADLSLAIFEAYAEK